VADERPARWWQTIPGALTALAAVLTAATGLIVALRPATAPFGRPSTPPAAEAGSLVLPASTAAGGASSASPARGSRAIALPAAAEVKLAGGAMVVRLLSARLEPYNGETRSLVVTVRYTNAGRYPANFWDRSFRLLIDDVPRAPISDLNKLVDGQSAEEGDVVFQVPATATRVTLRIINGDEHTDLPLDLEDVR
jgi:hypothetical protein